MPMLRYVLVYRRRLKQSFGPIPIAWLWSRCDSFHQQGIGVELCMSVCVCVSRTHQYLASSICSFNADSQPMHCRTLNSAILGWRCHILYVSPPSLTSFSESKKRKKPSLMTSLHQLPVSLSTTESFPTDFMVTPCIKQCWNLFITNWCT